MAGKGAHAAGRNCPHPTASIRKYNTKPHNFRYCTAACAITSSNRGGAVWVDCAERTGAAGAGCRRFSKAAVRYPASTCAANRRMPSTRLPSSCSPAVRITKDGPEQMQAGRRADASCGVSSRLRTASATAAAAGANPPRNPMSSTPPAAGLRTPMSRATGRNTNPSTCPAPQRMSRTETMRNGNSDTSSGPPHRASPCCSARAQHCGAANTSPAVPIAVPNSTTR